MDERHIMMAVAALKAFAAAITVPVGNVSDKNR